MTGQCPACSRAGSTVTGAIMECRSCGALFTSRGDTDPAEAKVFVRLSEPMLANAGPQGQFYFDFMVSTPGLRRRIHGWADRATKRVVQWG